MGIFFLIWVSGLSKVLLENLLDYRALAIKQMTSIEDFQAFIHLKSRGGNPRRRPVLQTDQCSACEVVGGN